MLLHWALGCDLKNDSNTVPFLLILVAEVWALKTFCFHECHFQDLRGFFSIYFWMWNLVSNLQITYCLNSSSFRYVGKVCFLHWHRWGWMVTRAMSWNRLFCCPKLEGCAFLLCKWQNSYLIVKFNWLPRVSKSASYCHSQRGQVCWAEPFQSMCHFICMS